MSKHFLTIVIPTYNRAEDLDFCLGQVLPQVSANADRAHIYISDNASTDSTPSVVERHAAARPGLITYHRQPENLTASPNFDHAVRNVDSEYVYMLSDDDVVAPGFVSAMLSIIDEHPDIDYFYLNRVDTDYDLKSARIYAADLSSSFVKTYATGGKLLREHLDGPSCVSTNLFRRSIWLGDVEPSRLDCCGYVWFSRLCHGMVSRPSAYVSYPLFASRLPRVQRYAANWPWYCTQGLGKLMSLMDESEPGIRDAWLQRQQRDEWRGYLMTMAEVARCKEAYKPRLQTMLPYVEGRLQKLFVTLCAKCLNVYVAKALLLPFFAVAKVFRGLRKLAGKA